nr:MAG TPA: hypothetical protein [Caudoviricetes sp.]
MKITIKTTKYNEVDPKEIKRLFDLGARLVKGEHRVAEIIGVYTIKGQEVVLYADDDIRLNNIVLPLSVGGVYDQEIVINVEE